MRGQSHSVVDVLYCIGALLCLFALFFFLSFFFAVLCVNYIDTGDGIHEASVILFWIIRCNRASFIGSPLEYQKLPRLPLARCNVSGRAWIVRPSKCFLPGESIGRSLISLAGAKISFANFSGSLRRRSTEPGFSLFVLTESMTLQVHTVLDYVSSAAGVAALD